MKKLHVIKFLFKIQKCEIISIGHLRRRSFSASGSVKLSSVLSVVLCCFLSSFPLMWWPTPPLHPRVARSPSPPRERSSIITVFLVFLSRLNVELHFSSDSPYRGSIYKLDNQLSVSAEKVNMHFYLRNLKPENVELIKWRLVNYPSMNWLIYSLIVSALRVRSKILFTLKWSRETWNWNTRLSFCSVTNLFSLLLK